MTESAVLAPGNTPAPKGWTAFLGTVAMCSCAPTCTHSCTRGRSRRLGSLHTASEGLEELGGRHLLCQMAMLKHVFSPKPVKFLRVGRIIKSHFMIQCYRTLWVLL